MSASKNQRALLMEIMIAVLFFALCASVLLQTFASAREYSRRAGLESETFLEAQSLAASLYAAQDMSAQLEALGFEETGAVWTRQAGDYRIEVELGAEKAPAGVLHTALVRMLRNESELAQLPVARYVPGEAVL